MQQLTSLRRRRLALPAVVALTVAACGGGAGTASPPGAATPGGTSPAAATSAPATPGGTSPAATDMGTPAASPSPSGQANPYDGASPGTGEGLKVGYISLGESIPFVKLVSDSIRREADVAGVEIVFCDSQVDAAEALECAQNLRVQGVEGVLNFQAFADSAPEICEAYGNVPTIAIDIEQEPCQVAFMGADNRRAGEIAGAAVGEYMKREHDCEYNAVLTLESPQVGEVNEARTGGMIDGFEAACGEIEQGKLQRLGIGGTTDAALTQVSDALSSIRAGGQVVVLSLNDDMALGALAAARTSGRADELKIGAQGADPSAWKEIACNPNWIADAAYFPERYGRILIPAIIDILAGKSVPEQLFTPHEAITKDNIRTIYPDTPAC